MSPACVSGVSWQQLTGAHRTWRRITHRALSRSAGPAAAYSLTKAFALLDVSPSFGHALVKAGKIQVVRLGPGSPRVTDAEIERLLREGIKGTAYPRTGGEAA